MNTTTTSETSKVADLTPKPVKGMVVRKNTREAIKGYGDGEEVSLCDVRVGMAWLTTEA